MKTFRFRDVLRAPETDRKKVRFDVDVPTKLSELQNDLPPPTVTIPGAVALADLGLVTDKVTTDESLGLTAGVLSNMSVSSPKVTVDVYAGVYRVHCDLLAQSEGTFTTVVTLRLKASGTTIHTVTGTATFALGYRFALSADTLVSLGVGQTIDASVEVSSNPNPNNITYSGKLSVVYEAAP